MPQDEAWRSAYSEVLPDDVSVTEKKTFGGLTFLVAGHLAVSASGQGGMMVRVDPDSSEDLVTTTEARIMEMRERPMRGC